MKFLRITFLIIKDLITLPLSVLSAILGLLIATIFAIIYRDIMAYAFMWYWVKEHVIAYVNWCKDFANTGKW